MSNAIELLQRAGIPVAGISEEERIAVAALSEDEVQTLIRIYEKAHPETKGFAATTGPTNPLPPFGGLPGLQPGARSSSAAKGNTQHDHNEKGSFLF